MKRRRVIQLLGGAATVGLSGCASLANQVGGGEGSTPRRTATDEPSGDGNGTTPTGTEPPGSTGTSTPKEEAAYDVQQPSGPVPAVSVPAAPESFTYPMMGAGDAPVTATIYGNWKCPYTREFVLGSLQELVPEFVESGDVRFEFRTVAYQGGDPFLGPDAPRASRTGLEIWEQAPEKFWEYFATVYASQPPERYAWATLPQLEAFANAAGIESFDAIERAVEQGAKSDVVERTSENAMDVGISTVPRVVVDGRVTAPTVDLEATVSALEDALDGQ